MMLLCDEARMKGRRIWCGDRMPCAHVRYCQLSGKYFQTDAAKNCVRRRKDEQDTKTGQVDSDRI